MKFNKQMLAAAMSLGFVGYAGAQCNPGNSTTIYFTGSTAFRAATMNAIEACLNAGFTYEAYSESTTPPAPLTAHQTAGVINYYGSLASDGTCVIIKCAFSGSEAGYADLKNCANPATKGFQATPVSFPLVNSDNTTAAAFGDTNHVDLAMADNTQPFSQPASRTPILANTCIAGVIPFKWVKNAQTAGDIAGNPAYNRLVNVSHAQLRTCILNGSKAALFTGNSADTQWVYVAGRDNQSGTRANALLNLGLAVNTPVKQTIIGGLPSGPPTLGALGNGGQPSGGTLANTLKLTGSLSQPDTINVGNTGWIAIGYLGAADAAAAEGGTPPAVALTLDGVTESQAAIVEGQYSYFGYEVCALAGCKDLTTAAGKLFTCLCGKWADTSIFEQPFEIPLSLMHAIKGSFPSTIVDSSDPIHQ